MRQETRFKFNAYLSRVAELNGIDAGDVSKKFTVEPSVTQTLMNTMQESSDFLTRINIVPVSEMKGEKIGIGVTGSIASTTDTAGGTERQPKDFSKLASNKYECDQINFDFYIRYKTLDLWARYQDFQLRVRAGGHGESINPRHPGHTGGGLHQQADYRHAGSAEGRDDARQH